MQCHHNHALGLFFLLCLCMIMLPAPPPSEQIQGLMNRCSRFVDLNDANRLSFSYAHFQSGRERHRNKDYQIRIKVFTVTEDVDRGAFLFCGVCSARHQSENWHLDFVTVAPLCVGYRTGKANATTNDHNTLARLILRISNFMILLLFSVTDSSCTEKLIIFITTPCFVILNKQLQTNRNRFVTIWQRRKMFRAAFFRP